MHIPTASLTLSATVAFGLFGALGNGDLARAEPTAVVIVEAAPDASLAADRWRPQSGQREAHSTDAANDRAGGQPPPELDIGDAATPNGERSAMPSLPAPLTTIESSLASAVISPMRDDWTWDREFKETIRPLYQQLADSGVIDAVDDFKSYLAMGTAHLLDVPPGTDYVAAHNAAPWATETHHRSPGLLEKDRLVAAVLLDELIAAIKPWLLTLVGLYVLWHMVRLSIDYSRWKMSHARKRGSRKTRRRRHSPASRNEGGS